MNGGTMSKSVVTAAVLAISFASTPIYAKVWSPDLPTIQKLEAEIQAGNSLNSSRTQQLAEYTRYYAGYTEKSRRLIVGEFVHPVRSNEKPTGIHLVRTREEFPQIEGGGCTVITVICDAGSSKVLSMQCNGEI
jgi:hypothetical protein